MTSSKDIEREVETQRASVESTLDALKAKMSFGQMVDEFGGYVGADEARRTLRTAGRQVRDNPVAFALVGVGLAWLMFGGGDGSRDRYDDRYDFDDDWDDRERAASAYPGEPGGLRYGSAYGSPYAENDDGGKSRLSRAAHAVGDAVSGAGERISDAVSGAGARLSDAAGKVGASASRAGSSGRERLHGVGEGLRSRSPDIAGARRATARSGRKAAGMLAEAMDRQPLMVGAFAVAVGAAIGAALPTTRTESRWMGERRDDLLDEAKSAALNLKDQAMHAAAAGVDAASRRADEEGLTPSTEGKTLAAKVETVVKAGIEGAREDFSSGDDKKPQASGAGTAGV